jgi:hypothetical protein
MEKLLRQLVTISLVLFSAGKVTAQPQARVTLVKASRLLDPRTGNVLSPVAALIENGRINEVGSPSKVQGDAPAGAKTIDLGNANLLPGLIDSHTHLLLDVVVPPEAQSSRRFNGDRVPDLLSAIVEAPSKRVLLGAQMAREDLESGFTTVRNLGHSGVDGDAALRDAMNAGRIPGPRILPRVVDLKAADGTILKATYFAAAKSGPGVLLLHQINRTRKAWDDVGVQLAAAGIHTLTLDMSGYGDSGGTPCAVSLDVSLACKRMPGDIDTALQYLVSQPSVKRDVIGVGGAGLLGVDNSVQAARRHSAEVKSLVLLSGETFQPNLKFLRQASQLPGLFVVSDDDEYPPTQEAMELLYITSSNPGKKFVHYSAAQGAPWLWYEPFDIGRVPANGGHGTDMFKPHPELPGIIVDWFVTTLINTPGHAPADTVASATILNQIELPGGVVQVTQQLTEARRKDSEAQLWPEITVDILGSDHLRVGETKAAIEIFKLNLLAYPDSADAHSSLADAYLADGQKDLARRYAEKTLALLDSHTAPASSWSDTEPRRGEIRRDAQRLLKKLNAAQ